jgi:hypothetical protein
MRIMDTIEIFDHVDATLNYLAPMAERPVNYTYEPPSGIPRSNTRPDAHLLPIRNARSVAPAPVLDHEGFQLVEQRSAVKDFYDEDELRRVYYGEAERLIKEVTGASRVLVFDHTIRRHVPGADDRAPNAPRQPATRVHVDQTATFGAQRVRHHLPDEADALLRHRVAIVNVWRPIRGPLLDAPLALCDARSVAPADLIPADLVYPDRTGETYAVAFNPAHRWFYVKAMRSDEALLIKCYDSAEDGRARFAPHTSFADPTAPADAPLRESIELRALVFWPVDPHAS